MLHPLQKESLLLSKLPMVETDLEPSSGSELTVVRPGRLVWDLESCLFGDPFWDISCQLPLAWPPTVW